MDEEERLEQERLEEERERDDALEEERHYEVKKKKEKKEKKEDKKSKKKKNEDEDEEDSDNDNDTDTNTDSSSTSSNNSKNKKSNKTVSNFKPVEYYQVPALKPKSTNGERISHVFKNLGFGILNGGIFLYNHNSKLLQGYTVDPIKYKKAGFKESTWSTVGVYVLESIRFVGIKAINAIIWIYNKSRLFGLLAACGAAGFLIALGFGLSGGLFAGITLSLFVGAIIAIQIFTIVSQLYDNYTVDNPIYNFLANSFLSSIFYQASLISATVIFISSASVAPSLLFFTIPLTMILVVALSALKRGSFLKRQKVEKKKSESFDASSIDSVGPEALILIPILSAFYVFAKEVRSRPFENTVFLAACAVGSTAITLTTTFITNFFAPGTINVLGSLALLSNPLSIALIAVGVALLIGTVILMANAKPADLAQGDTSKTGQKSNTKDSITSSKDTSNNREERKGKQGTRSDTKSTTTSTEKNNKKELKGADKYRTQDSKLSTKATKNSKSRIGYKSKKDEPKGILDQIKNKATSTTKWMGI